MNDYFCYQIHIRGQVEQADLAHIGPPGLSLTPDGAGGTLLRFSGDQSALVGLIRQLHGLGLTLLAVDSRAVEAPGSSVTYYSL